MSKSELEIKDFEYYVVLMDSNENYVISYGYEQRPAIIDLKFMFEQLITDKTSGLHEAIPDFKKVIDYVSIDIMNHKKFVKYMEKQETIANKKEAKAKSKKGKK